MLYMQKLSWYQSLGLALLVFILARGISKTYALPYLAHSLASLVLLLRYLLDWPQMRRQFQQRDAKGKSTTNWRVFIPPFLMAWLNYNLAAWRSYATMCGLKPKFKPGESDGLALASFAYLERGQYQTVFLIILIGLFVEIPFSALMIQLIGLTNTVSKQAHWLLLFLTGYSLFLLIADRHQLRQTQHHLFNDHLRLRIAQRFAADLPLHAIAKVAVFKQDKRLWCAQHKISMFDCQQVSPADAPTILLELKPADLQMQSFKLWQPVPRYLFIYVDQANDFVHQLQLAMADYAERETISLLKLP